MSDLAPNFAVIAPFLNEIGLKLLHTDNQKMIFKKSNIMH